MTAMKLFQTYDQQVELLQSRGMEVGGRDGAVLQLKRVNYYRLSGCWYPFRRIVGDSRTDEFFPGTTLADVMKLYDFDAALRAMAFATLAPIELTVRVLLGHALGNINERIHLEPDLLNSRARGVGYERWKSRYDRELADSHEDFVEHHWKKYGGELPVWAQSRSSTGVD